MEFLKEWLPEGRFPTEIDKHISCSDNEVTAGMWKAAADSNERSHALAKRIISREHFRQVYERSSSEELRALEPGKRVYDGLVAQFGKDEVRRDAYTQTGGSYDFPVYTKARDIVSSVALSPTLSKIPTFSVDRVYVSIAIRDEAKRWVDKNRDRIITGAIGEEHSSGKL
jgi:hypothetical protein